MAATKITVNSNGSFKVEGDFEIVDRAGNTYDLGGNNHDHDSNQNEEMLKFFFHLDKIWHPLILDPKY